MLENNRHLFACCVVCGAIGAYFVSVYVLVIVIVVCAYLLFIDFKLLGQGVSVTKVFSFPVPSWIKTIITALMNSYHLSKPLESEPSTRRGSPYSPNVPIPRRPSCRSGRFTCLDENTDYVNRRNGIGLCNTNPAFNNSYSNNLHGFRRHNNFSDTDNSSKMEDFSSPQTSPWARRQNYSGNEYNSVRRVQTVAGPLLATSGLTKRKSNDFGLFVDANSPGLASRIVQYREEGMLPGSTVWTHQPQYSSPGQFPMVHLSHSPSSLPVLSPLSSQKASRRSVRVKIAPPDPLGSRLYPLSKNNITYTSALQADHSTKSVIETLKEISRKRIHSQLEDNDDDAAKRQKRCGPPDMSTTLPINDPCEAENVSKRLREESPRQQETSPPTRPTKRVRNNEILSSLSSSRKILQGGGMKRKTQNLDWSRCSTPVLGKQQKTTGEDTVFSPSPVPITLAAKSPLAASQSLPSEISEEEERRKSSQRNINTSENERMNTRLSLTNTPLSGKETPKVTTMGTPDVVSVAVKVVKKGPSSVDDTPWQKNSPFVSVSSPDDVIDDVSALEEKREEDRRSRLMSMMTVISGGEPPVKMSEKVVSKRVTIVDTSANTVGIVASSLGNSSMPQSSVTSVVSPIISSEKTAPFIVSSLPSGWGSNTASLTGSGSDSMAATTQILQPTTSPAPSVLTPASETSFPNNIPTSSPMFNFGNSSPTVSDVLQKTQNSVVTPTSFSTSSTTPCTTGMPITPVFGSSSTQVPAQQITPVSTTPVFSSSGTLFGSKTTETTKNTNSINDQGQQTPGTVTITAAAGHGVAATAPSTTTNLPFGFTPIEVSFGVPSASTIQTTSSVSHTTMTAGVPVSNSPSSLMFQLRPAVSGLGQENSIASSSGVFSSSVPIATTSSGPTNSFTKPITFGSPSKTPQFNPSTHTPSVTSAFGAPAVTTCTVSTSSPAATFVFGTVAANSTPSSGLQTKSGIFSFGSASSPNLSSQSTTGNDKPVFGSASGGFGQPAEAITPQTAASSQLVNSQTAAKKVGGFKFDFPGKTDFNSQSNLPSNASPNIFGNTAPAAIGSELKPFTFVSGKPIEIPFALNVGNNNTVTTVAQSQAAVNPFGFTAMQQKVSDGSQLKESLFSFGAGAAASPAFSAHQAPVFSVQSTAIAATTANSGFSFSLAPATGFSQPPSGTCSFSGQPSVVTTTSFSTPSCSSATSTTVASSAFSFGSTPNQTPQTMFAFGANVGTTEAQQGNPFTFGSSNSTTPSNAAGLFGQSAVPAAPGQPQAGQTQAPAPTAAAPGGAPAQAFQFGTPNSTPQLSGTFSFGAPSNTNTASTGFPGGGSFQINAAAAANGGSGASSSGFGGGHAMFSIGSGSTAPRIRNARARRTK